MDASLLDRLDHVVLAVPDLDAGCRFVHDHLGVEPVRGGRHPSFGTANALVGLGPGRYLEIAAPDPNREESDLPKLFHLDQTTEARVDTWVIRADLGGTVPAAIGEPMPGSRMTAEGTMLDWQLTDPYTDRWNGTVPVLIDWGSTPHPSDSLTHACEIESIALGHPEAESANSAMTLIGLPPVIGRTTSPRIAVDIRCPRGLVRLES